MESLTDASGREVLFILDGSVATTGAFVAVQRQARLLSGTVSSVLVLREDHAISSDDLAPFAQVITLPLRPLRRSLRSIVAYVPALLWNGLKLARALRRADCRRLQVNDYYLLEGAIARLFGYRGRLVTWVRIDPANYGGPVARLWLAAARRASDQVAAVSEFIRSRLPGRMRARLVYDPVPDLPAALPATGQRLVFVGNYIPGKGQDVAIRAFHRIAAAFPGAELIFHGGTMGLESNRDYLADLRRLAAAGAGSGRIALGPFAANSGAALDGALAALVLSRSESFSLTCQEASARGVAVIATRCGGPEEIVEDGETGWLVPVDDDAAVAEAMRQALHDPGGTARRGAAGARLMRDRFRQEVFIVALTRMFDLPQLAATERKRSTKRGACDASE
jgi:glycosyltransferase involved in cell wall biosynthesis